MLSVVLLSPVCTMGTVFGREERLSVLLQGLRLLAKHLRHELYDIPLAEITEDQIKPFAGKARERRREV